MEASPENRSKLLVFDSDSNKITNLGCEFIFKGDWPELRMLDIGTI